MIICTDSNFSLTIPVGLRSGSSEGSSLIPVNQTDLGGPDSNVSHMRVDDCSVNEVDFDHPSHLRTVLAGLYKLRARGQLCDVVLKTENQTFQAHRAVLAACSDYFRAMFTDPMREREQTEILLAGVSAPGVQFMLEYVYTSRLALSLANIQDILSAASHLQFFQVVEACENYLQAQIDVENCVDIVTIAESYSLTKLRSKVYQFMSENLAAFSKGSEFHRLSAAQFEHLLEADFPVDVSEEKFLEILLRWLEIPSSASASVINNNSQHQQQQQSNSEENNSRLAHAHRLLRRVNFEEIHPVHLKSMMDLKSATTTSLPKSFISRVANLSMDIVNNGGGLTSGVGPPASSFLYSNYSQMQQLVNSRGMMECVVKVGGFGPQGPTNQISYLRRPSSSNSNSDNKDKESSQHQWKHLTAVPHLECSNFGTAVLKNELYVAGGCFSQRPQQQVMFVSDNDAEEERLHPYVFRYDPRHNRWTSSAPMLRGRCRFSLTASNDGKKLYAIGGVYEEEQQGQQGIMVDGEGRAFDVNSTFAEKYDSETDVWTPVNPPIPDSNLRIRRSKHAATRFQNFLLLTGGVDHSVDDDMPLDTVLVYHMSTDVWESSSRKMPTPRADHSCFVWRDKILLIGGWFVDNRVRAEDEENEDEDDIPVHNNIRRTLVKEISTYNFHSDSWIKETEIPTPRFHCGITVAGDKIYVVGGCVSDDVFDRATGLVETYDLITRKWDGRKSLHQTSEDDENSASNNLLQPSEVRVNNSESNLINEDRKKEDDVIIPDYPEEVWEHSCLSLFVPKYREDREAIIVRNQQ